MTYPQPNANNYATGGYPFFRLNTQLVSPGDIYESEQGATAFAIGPESDIANARIYYLDSQLTPTLMNEAVVGQRRGLVGTVFAANDQNYLPANRPGRILIAADDVYDPSYVPSTWGNADPIEFVAPVLDVIQYFSPQQSLTPQRNDKRYYFQTIVPGGEGATNTKFMILPYYGRKYASICCTNIAFIETFSISILGVNYLVNDASSSLIRAQETVLVTATPITARATHQEVIVATLDGVFDALVISLATSGATLSLTAVLRIVFSDEEV